MGTEEGKTYALKTSARSVRKYPNVIWFPRSKTDPREIREVLKLALKTQTENREGFFNDKLLGIKMAQIGSISVVGLDGEAYVESYKNKSTGDVSFITNARMLMRLFRFLGFVRRLEKGQYIVTDLGKMYCEFSGDFPDYRNGISEEKILLDSLSNFSFYSVGDDSSYRDPRFRVRPFLWLLHNLAIEPQCIYQLIITAFASQGENSSEDKRIHTILSDLRSGKTTLKEEWKKVGLDPNDYSCVHNFYDSVKILVYLGISLGLIGKTSDPIYGKKITGKARHLKQATIFYTLTEKGEKMLEGNLGNKLVYYDELYKLFGDHLILEACFLLATLNYRSGNIAIARIKKEFYESKDVEEIIAKIQKGLSIRIDAEDGYLSLQKPISFSFYQQVPPEIMTDPIMERAYNRFMTAIKSGKGVDITKDVSTPIIENANLAPYIQIDEKRRFSLPRKSSEKLDVAIRYPGMDEVFGGKDRFSGRVSPTNSIVLVDGLLYVDQKTDALDLLGMLRLKDPDLPKFIEHNLPALIDVFMAKSDTWEKDQHYTWVRNAFRHFGMEAIYSGSGGMLSRADVSILRPFIGGVEIKSPRENRGTLNTKAIRQAVDAKIQVADMSKDKKSPRIAIAIGRRISENAVREERKWANENQPVLLLPDVLLHYLVLKSASIKFQDRIVELLAQNHGPMTSAIIKKFIDSKDPNIDQELQYLSKYLGFEKDEG